MMTPQEVAEFTFTKSRLGGYNAAEVDQFLESVTTDYTMLYKDNAVLKSKLKVLATKLAEYRETEDAMRSVIASARKTASDIIAEAQDKREEMLAEADAEVADYRRELQQQIADAEAQAAAAREATSSFVATVRLLLDRQNDLLEQLGSVKGVTPVDPSLLPRDEVARTAAAIDDSIRRMLSDEELAALDAAGAAAEADPVAAYTQDDTPDVETAEGAEAGADPEEQPFAAVSADGQEPTRRMDFTGTDFSQNYNA